MHRLKPQSDSLFLAKFRMSGLDFVRGENAKKKLISASLSLKWQEISDAKIKKFSVSISMGYRYVIKVGHKKDNEQNLDNSKRGNHKTKIGPY